MTINTTYSRIRYNYFVDGVSLTFPQGISETAALEMAANVWEYCDLSGQHFVNHTYEITGSHITKYGVMVDLEYIGH